ncbi:uncharacterized protein L969DRAFT_94757 [Mixia osmundae IAM 14324]|uniref:Uncharacterized protein n=1 Tax=Mixia osmundae (strain CBS 9802 / IAM 14324 / JCM 22182 / KY 12970) TaxID=764103 RepID=G7E456_MIXOS|nr:uncharacterized protein L969DRAFT_94757 [Mixia osmundae IAM 14324]KEI39711.1 hypothetical protein L969DRAFT_94757 [Mixia osmundae IAM 14324]GAA97616.1 hypothetical protein E5Q_04294 [Mixia osmundae IAM 14324]
MASLATLATSSPVDGPATVAERAVVRKTQNQFQLQVSSFDFSDDLELGFTLHYDWFDGVYDKLLSCIDTSTNAKCGGSSVGNICAAFNCHTDWTITPVNNAPLTIRFHHLVSGKVTGWTLLSGTVGKDHAKIDFKDLNDNTNGETVPEVKAGCDGQTGSTACI